MLELFATAASSRSAVHVTKLGVGEGLVGTIAQDSRDAQPRRGDRAIPNSPTGPKPARRMFHSFAGVPIVRRERAIGVLTVQHADPRAL